MADFPLFTLSSRRSLQIHHRDRAKQWAEINLDQRMSDHIHILIGLKPAMALADLVRDIKADSSNFVNKKKWVRGKFSWQEGYGAFSYGHSQLDTIIRYIQNQERHHRKRSFKEEYLTWLKKYEIALKRNMSLSLSNSSFHISLLTELRLFWVTPELKHSAPLERKPRLVSDIARP